MIHSRVSVMFISSFSSRIRCNMTKRVFGAKKEVTGKTVTSIAVENRSFINYFTPLSIAAIKSRRPLPVYLSIKHLSHLAISFLYIFYRSRFCLLPTRNLAIPSTNFFFPNVQNGIFLQIFHICILDQ